MKLKPCPFCGGDAALEGDREPWGVGSYHAVAACLNEDECHASVHAVEGTLADARVAAAARWNRRATREPSRAALQTIAEAALATAPAVPVGLDAATEVLRELDAEIAARTASLDENVGKGYLNRNHGEGEAQDREIDALTGVRDRLRSLTDTEKKGGTR